MSEKESGSGADPGAGAGEDGDPAGGTDESATDESAREVSASGDVDGGDGAGAVDPSGRRSSGDVAAWMDLAGDPKAEVVEHVSESDPERIARELAELRTRVDGLERKLSEAETEIEDLTDRLKRKQADFENYKKRMDERRESEREQAAADLLTRMLEVRDNLVRALDQDEDADIRGGVESTLRQFDDVLDAEEVDVIEPSPGDEVDPHRHEVLVRVEADTPPGTVAEVHRPGYVMGDRVLREAQVTVSDGETAE